MISFVQFGSFNKQFADKCFLMFILLAGIVGGQSFAATGYPTMEAKSFNRASGFLGFENVNSNSKSDTKLAAGAEYELMVMDQVGIDIMVHTVTTDPARTLYSIGGAYHIQAARLLAGIGGATIGSTSETLFRLGAGYSFPLGVVTLEPLALFNMVKDSNGFELGANFTFVF